MYVCVFVLALCFSAAAALPTMSIDRGIDDSLDFVNDFVDTINLTGELLLDDTHEEMWKRKCEANGGSEAFQLSKRAGFEFAQCVQKIVNITVLRVEIAEAKKTGDLDEVFPKYCQKKDEFTPCFKMFVETLQVCFEEKELKQRAIVDDIIEKFVKFICFKDGVRLAMFIADKGPQCFEKKWESLSDCVKASYGVTIPSDPFGEMTELPIITKVPSFSFEKEDCLKLIELQRCAMSAVETCEESTPSNIFDSVFNYVIKSTPCIKVADPSLRS